MPDFSTILQDPKIRQLVQEGTLERAFHDALFPKLLYRSEAMPQLWPANVGDSMIFTGAGLIKPKMQPIQPGTDPAVSSYDTEQWAATLQQYADTIDTHMPTSITAIANLFYRNAQQLGLSSGQALNRIARNRMYNAALAGHGVVDGAHAAASTVIRLKRLNGFTTARDATGSPVRFDAVSSNNPLPITMTLDDASEQLVNVVAFAADNPGDEYGPGTITISAGVTGGRSLLDRGALRAIDRTSLVRVGGGTKIDDVGSADLLRLADIRSAVSRFRQSNVPEHNDGRYHCHLDPTSEAQIFSDTEWQRLLTSLPDYFMYKQFAIGELLGVVYYRNTEAPQPDTVEGGLTATFDPDDPFPGELFNSGAVTGVQVHRPLFSGQGSLYEYYQDLGQLLTESGVTGKTGQSKITNNGIEVLTDRIQLIFRAPLNRLQDLVSTSWKFIGDWPIRTDVTTGDVARYKRQQVIEHGS